MKKDCLNDPWNWANHRMVGWFSNWWFIFKLMGVVFCGERKRNQPSSEDKGFCLSGNRYIHLHLPPIGALKKIIIDSKKCWESSGRGPALDNFPGCPIFNMIWCKAFHIPHMVSRFHTAWHLGQKIWAPCWMALAQLPLSCWFNCSFDDLIPNSLVSKVQTRLQHHCPWPSMTIHDQSTYFFIVVTGGLDP